MLSATVYPKHKGLVFDALPGLKAIMPAARDLPNGKMFAPHGLEETRLLRNMGVRVPSPIYHQYDWNQTTPFEAQKATAAMLCVEPRAYVLSTMGTGKTRSTLYAYDFMRKNGHVRKMLVVAPLSTLNFTWAREVLHNFPYYNVGIAYGAKEKRRKVLADPNFDIYVINHDGIKVMEREIMDANFDVVCIDEAAVFRNHTSARHKSMARIAKPARYVWALTGTPTPKEPTDAFGLIRIVDPASTKARSFSRFRDELMLKVGQFRFVPRPGASKKVFDYMQPAVRFTMAECMDIPPVMTSDREVQMSSRQKAAYERMRKYCIDLHEGDGVTAVNNGVLLSKLLQISSGCVFDRNKNAILLDAKDRLAVTLEAVQESEHKAIVFCPFKPLVPMVAEHLRKAGVKCYEITGETSKSARDTVFADFQDHTEQGGVKEAIVAHPGTMSHGLTLTAASLVLWYAPTQDLEIYEQANARIVRPGQTARHTQLIHLQATTVDRQVYSRLMAKQKVQTGILDLFEE